MPILCLISTPKGVLKQIKITAKEAAAVVRSYEKKEPFTIHGNWVTAGNVAGIFQDKFGSAPEQPLDITPESHQLESPKLSKAMKAKVDREIKSKFNVGVKITDELPKDFKMKCK